MSYKSILICPSTRDNTRLLLRIACQIAGQRRDSRILGVHWIPEVREFHHGERATERVNSDIDVPMLSHVKELANEFHSCLADTQWPSEWTSLGVSADQSHNIVVDYSRCADLLLVEQPASEQVHNSLALELIIRSGKPVLIIPPGTETPLSLRHAIVAWNSTRASARAAFDALPLLKHADSTESLWIEEGGPADKIADRIHADFVAALALHQIRCSVDRVSKTFDPETSMAGRILSKVNEHKADLLVAGAPALQTSGMVSLGKTSMELLMSCQIPVLFSG